MIKIGGFQPFTLSDFPGHVAAVVFTQGCNFRCPFCHNAVLLARAARQEDMVPETEVLGFLHARRGLLDGVVVTGGEPTLQPGLASFLKHAKSIGYKTKLDTNGSRPQVLAALIEEELLDYIAMDVKAPLDQYARLAGVPVPTRDLEESIALISWSRLPHEFRTTVVPALLTSQHVAAIRAILPSGSPHRVQRFIPENALDPEACGVRVAL